MAWMRTLAVAALMIAAPGVADAQPVLSQSTGTASNVEPLAWTLPGMQAWRMRYWTRNDRGAAIEATAVVAAPSGPAPASGRPVLVWAHGTWGVVEKCLHSQEPDFLTSSPGIGDAVARGYTVVAPDYPGIGTQTPHPYLVGIDTGRAVLDAVRAARGIREAGAGSSFAVWGESQGGHAALWAGQLARDYAPELRLTGVAAAAPPTDLVENLRAGGDPSIRAFLTAFTAYSWSRHFAAPLATLGKPSTQRVITRLAQNNCIVLGKKPRLGTMLGVAVLRRDLKDVDLGRIQPWARIARENSPAARPYGVPLLIAQNPKDMIVGADVTRAFARRMCANGARLRWISIVGQGHETSARDSSQATLDWIDARFGGRPAPSDCGRI